MDSDRSAEWAARIAAWHRRDPLARPVAPADVGDAGWVDLPFAGAADRARWRAVFSAPVAGLPASRVAAWALRHGQRSRPEPAQPLHQVPIDRRLLPEQGEVALLWVGRATLTTPQGTTTLLVDPRPGGAVLGRRLRSRPRAVAAAAALIAVVGLVTGFAWVVSNGRERPSGGGPVSVSAAASGAASGAVSSAIPASAPVAASAAVSAAASAVTSAAASSTASAAASSTASAAASSAASKAASGVGVGPGVASTAAAPGSPASAARPVPAAPAPSRATFAAVAAASVGAPASAAASRDPATAAARRPDPAEARSPALAPAVEPVVTTGRIVEDRPVFLDESDRIAARATGEAARAAAAARRIARHPVAWALAGPALRTPAEAQLAGRDLAKALAAAGSPACPRIDPMPAGDDWRTVCWPFLHRADAETLRAALGARAASLELIQF